MQLTSAQLNAKRIHSPKTTNKQKQFEVWERDQYNQNTIVAETDTLEGAIAEAKRHVHDKNRNNPLTFDEQKRNWNHYVVFVADEDGNVDEARAYAGNLVHGRHKVLVSQEDGSLKEDVLDIAKTKLKFYLGELPADAGPWYFADARKRPVERIDHPDVVGKVALFVQKIRQKTAAR